MNENGLLLSRQYCRYTKSPGFQPLLKAIWESSRAKENLAPVGLEPTTSGLDLPMLYRLSYEASTGAGRGNLGSEVAVRIQMIRYIAGFHMTSLKFKLQNY